MGPDDVDVVELHDATSAEELYALESLGLLPGREAGAATIAGDTDIGGSGVCVNPSGGLVARGHPLGATGYLPDRRARPPAARAAPGPPASGGPARPWPSTPGGSSRADAAAGRHPRPRREPDRWPEPSSPAGDRRPRQDRHQRGPLGPPRHERPWITERTGIRSGTSGAPRPSWPSRPGARPWPGRGRTGADIDLLVLATTTPDALVPGTSATVQEGLGAARGGLRPERGVLGVRLRPGRRPRPGPGRGPAGPRHRQRDPVADHRLGRPHPGRHRGRRGRRRGARGHRRARASSWPGTSGPTGPCGTCSSAITAATST